ncbi:DNA gyrase inhibitor YacG [Legionella bozemanae]|uniref:DNA gyrase inhibitor YacG n=1 Tax=Legionella bozemanae TaxID=447 RepID=UPI00399CCEBA
MNINQKITCPICGKHNTWYSENRFKPFCSHRCKLIDLGEWASEDRKIPGNPLDPDLKIAVYGQDE